MKRLGGDKVLSTMIGYNFFLWWEQQVIVIQDYPYVGMDFKVDPHLLHPPDDAWGAIDKNIFMFFKVI